MDERFYQLFSVKSNTKVKRQHLPLMWTEHSSLSIFSPLLTSPLSEAMSSAALYNCLYLEISASLDHRTPELLECAVRLARGLPPWPPGTTAEDMMSGNRESITSRAKRFLSSLVPRYPREREVGRFLRQKSRSCHDLGAL